MNSKQPPIDGNVTQMGIGNRKTRRAKAASGRKAPQNVSVAFLQRQLGEAQGELQQLRNVLFSIIKEQGRVRFMKATLASLGPLDGMDARDTGDAYVVTYIKHDAASEPQKEGA